MTDSHCFSGLTGIPTVTSRLVESAGYSTKSALQPSRIKPSPGWRVVDVHVSFVVHAGPALSRVDDHLGLLAPSLGRTERWKESLVQEAQRQRLDVDRVLCQTDGDRLIEGFYGKVEDDYQVLSRFKFVRASFTQTLLDGDGHWQSRPVVPNRLRPGVDLFSPTVDKRWPSLDSETFAHRPRR